MVEINETRHNNVQQLSTTMGLLTMDDPPMNPLSADTVTALRNLYEAIKTMQDLPDTPQLMLLCGVFLEDINMLRESIDVYGADPRASISARNVFILRQFDITI